MWKKERKMERNIKWQPHISILKQTVFNKCQLRIEQMMLQYKKTNKCRTGGPLQFNCLCCPSRKGLGTSPCKRNHQNYLHPKLWKREYVPNTCFLCSRQVKWCQNAQSNMRNSPICEFLSRLIFNSHLAKKLLYSFQIKVFF